MVLLHSLADSLHLVEEGGEFVYSGITPGGIAPDVPQGSQALDAAPDIPVINATTSERGIEPGDIRSLGIRGDSIPTATLLEHALLTQGFMGTSKAAFPSRLRPQSPDSTWENLVGTRK